LRLLARAARGSMRDALSLTDQAIAFGGGQLHEGPVRQMLGAVDRGHALRLIEALAHGDGASVVQTVEGLRMNGLNAASTLEEMTGVLQRMAVHQSAPAALASGSDPDDAQIAQLAQAMPADETQLLYSLCLHGRGELGLAPDEYAGLTMVLLRLLAFKPAGTAEKKTPLKAAEPRPAPVAPPVAAPVATPVAVPAPAPVLAPTPVAAAAPRAPAPVPAPMAAAPVAPRAAPSASVTADAPPTDDDAPWPEPEDDAPPWDTLPPTAPAPAARPAPRVVQVPVRDAGTPGRLDQPRPSTPLQPTPEGEFWAGVVQQLVDAGAVSALVRELALQSQLVAREGARWRLRIERESLNQGSNRERLAAALQSIGHAVELVLEPGEVSDSPARRNTAEAERRQREAEQQILADPFVQTMMRDFGGTIVPGSLKASGR
jgi:DNA polymerase-3 subunit gamma/tau